MRGGNRGQCHSRIPHPNDGDPEAAQLLGTFVRGDERDGARLDRLRSEVMPVDLLARYADEQVAPLDGARVVLHTTDRWQGGAIDVLGKAISPIAARRCRVTRSVVHASMVRVRCAVAEAL